MIAAIIGRTLAAVFLSRKFISSKKYMRSCTLCRDGRWQQARAPFELDLLPQLGLQLKPHEALQTSDEAARQAWKARCSEPLQ